MGRILRERMSFASRSFCTGADVRFTGRTGNLRHDLHYSSGKDGKRIPACVGFDHGSHPPLPRTVDLEVGNTAGWETQATLRRGAKEVKRSGARRRNRPLGWRIGGRERCHFLKRPGHIRRG